MFDVFCIGNPLLDIISPVGDHTLAELGLTKGVINLIDEEGMERIMAKIGTTKAKLIPAGSEANAMMGLARLGSSVFFCGKVGDDTHGMWYGDSISKVGLHHHLPRELKTGRVISLVTPDTERTMLVYLGATSLLRSEEVPIEKLLESKMFYTTGYLSNNPAPRTALLACLHAAKAKGITVAFDLADAGVVGNDLDFFRSIIADYVDILFMNELEAHALTGKDGKGSLDNVPSRVKIAVFKEGSKGSHVRHEGKISFIPPIKVNAVDTTGAGDWYAAGFLHGRIAGASIEACGRLGSHVASLIVQQHGAFIERDLRSVAKDILGEKDK